MSNRICVFANRALPNVEASHEIGSGPSRLQIADVPAGQISLLGTQEKARRGPLTLAVQGKIVGATLGEVQAHLEGWKALRGTTDRLWRRMPGGGTEWCMATLESVSGVHGSRPNSRYQPLTWNFAVLSPAWYSSYTLDYIGHDFASGDLSIPTRHAGMGPDDTYLLVAESGGNIDQPSVIIEALPDPVIGFEHVRITNEQTGHYLDYTPAAATTETLLIDTAKPSVKIGGVGDYAHLTKSPTKREWFMIQPNQNNLLIAVTGRIARLTVTFYNAYA